MPDREMVMNWLSELAEPDWKSFHSISEVQIVAQDALALLKEQENEISRITNEYLNLVKVASKKPEIIRCKDCKHRPIKPNDYENGFDLEFPDGKCPCQCDDRWYSWYPPDDWFCADGERK